MAVAGTTLLTGCGTLLAIPLGLLALCVIGCAGFAFLGSLGKETSVATQAVVPSVADRRTATDSGKGSSSTAVVAAEILPETPKPTPVPVAEKSAESLPPFGRHFTDKTGKHSIDAEYIEFRATNSRVILRKRDGSELDMSFHDLSDPDKEWIRAENRRRAEERKASERRKS